jgi:hypothetical protein
MVRPGDRWRKLSKKGSLWSSSKSNLLGQWAARRGWLPEGIDAASRPTPHTHEHPEAERHLMSIAKTLAATVTVTKWCAAWAAGEHPGHGTQWG